MKEFYTGRYSWYADHHISWQNWTLGIWWGKFSPQHDRTHFAVDLGPIQLCWVGVPR